MSQSLSTLSVQKPLKLHTNELKLHSNFLYAYRRSLFSLSAIGGNSKKDRYASDYMCPIGGLQCCLCYNQKRVTRLYSPHVYDGWWTVFLPVLCFYASSRGHVGRDGPPRPGCSRGTCEILINFWIKFKYRGNKLRERYSHDLITRLNITN